VGAAVTPGAPRRAALGIVLLAAAALPAPAGGAGAAPLRLSVAFTGDVSGYLEPCG